MDYTEEQLTQIEQYASIYLKISDMAVILGISATQLREDIADKSTEVSRRYFTCETAASGDAAGLCGFSACLGEYTQQFVGHGR